MNIFQKNASLQGERVKITYLNGLEIEGQWTDYFPGDESDLSYDSILIENIKNRTPSFIAVEETEIKDIRKA